MNNVLVIIDGEDQKRVFSFPPNSSEEECFDKVKSSIEVGIKRKFFFENSEVPAKNYEEYYYLKNDSLILDERFMLETQITEKIRQQRDMLLHRLDVPFMMSLEDEDDMLKKHITLLKNFLRDVPSNLKLRHIEKEEDLLNFTPFQNIFTAFILRKGSGYTKPPKLTFGKPTGTYYGYPAEATATIEDGGISNIFITNNGCGYLSEPPIAISPPDDPDGEKAVIASGPIENIIVQDI